MDRAAQARMALMEPERSEKKIVAIIFRWMDATNNNGFDYNVSTVHTHENRILSATLTLQGSGTDIFDLDAMTFSTTPVGNLSLMDGGRLGKATSHRGSVVRERRILLGIEY
jgi:hypothetical protein